MNLKKTQSAVVLILLFAVTLAGVAAYSSSNATLAAEETKERGPTQFTCPMPEHGDVISDEPGRCPRCGMGLVPVKTKDSPDSRLPDACSNSAIHSCGAKQGTASPQRQNAEDSLPHSAHGKDSN